MKSNLNKKGLRQQLAEITFLDPTSLEFDSVSDEPIRCTTIGWLRELNSRWAKISWLDYEGEPNAGYGLVLPRGCIVSVKTLRKQG